ncbi:MAG: protein phosphatase 2C domain-containing protein [Polyangiaceae bacterium]
MKRCPVCSALCDADDMFCEVDGARLDGVPTQIGGISSIPAPIAMSYSRCSKCGSIESEDGFCRECGHRVYLLNDSTSEPPPRFFSSSDLLARVGIEQSEQSEATIGAICDQGLASGHNEDAFAFAHGDKNGAPWWALVVCDGISSASYSDRCAKLASEAAKDLLVELVCTSDLSSSGSSQAVLAAVQRAHAVSCSITERQQGKDEPGTTIVVALVHHQRLAVAWAGDSRAYWISKHAAEPLTKDHSWAVEAIESGEVTADEAMTNPLSHAITRCIGPLETMSPSADIHASVVTRNLAGHGQLMLCSDGLWNYLKSNEELRDLLSPLSNRPPIERARALVAHALTCGGHDNVTVVIADV